MKTENIDSILAVFDRTLKRWGLWQHIVSCYTQATVLHIRRLEGCFWIGLRTSPSFLQIGTTHFDVNIRDDVFYIVDIQLEQVSRGQGFGGDLYYFLSEIARELGCNSIVTAASGWTPNGETRADYLKRRGWCQDGRDAFKTLREPADRLERREDVER